VENEGKVALIHRALYGGKSVGRDFRNCLRSCMHHLGFKSCPTDPDVWMRPAIKSNGTKVCEYVLLYTDDSLFIGAGAASILRKEIGKYFELKEKSTGLPKLYLWGHLRLAGQWSQGLGLQLFPVCESCSSKCGGLYCQG
jgi:hypothetical protein